MSSLSCFSHDDLAFTSHGKCTFIPWFGFLIKVVNELQRKLEASASVRRQAKDAFTLAGCYFWSQGESIRLRPVFEKTSFECDDLFSSGPERLLPWQQWSIRSEPSWARCGVAVANKRALSPTMSRVLPLPAVPGLRRFSLLSAAQRLPVFMGFSLSFSLLVQTLWCIYLFIFFPLNIAHPRLFFLSWLNADLTASYPSVSLESWWDQQLLPAKSQASSIM